mmetsp:Transcript_126256/g.218750  ORF Transcript_126256/g.218750 Transcript_126256/m.218750 type:complete len:206 (+) Transcript_126256:946-1563(+)
MMDCWHQPPCRAEECSLHLCPFAAPPHVLHAFAGPPGPGPTHHLSQSVLGWPQPSQHSTTPCTLEPGPQRASGSPAWPPALHQSPLRQRCSSGLGPSSPDWTGSRTPFPAPWHALEGLSLQPRPGQCRPPPQCASCCPCWTTGFAGPERPSPAPHSAWGAASATPVLGTGLLSHQCPPPMCRQWPAMLAGCSQLLGHWHWSDAPS